MSTTTETDLRERAIQAAITEMALFTGNLEMKVRKAIDRYEFILTCEIERLQKIETAAHQLCRDHGFGDSNWKALQDALGKEQS